MKGVIGLSNFSPMQFQNSIRPFVLSREWKCTVFSKDKKYSKSKRYVFLFLGMPEFLQSVPALKGRECIAIIFDCVEKLVELKGLIHADKKTATSDTVKEALRPFLRKASLKPFEVQTTRRNYIVEVMDKHKADGFMHIYNTNFYAITNKELRETVKHAILSYFGGYVDAPKVIALLKSKMPKRGKAKEAVENFINLMASQEVKNLQLAIKAVTKPRSKITVEDAAKQFKAQAYDMRYMLATLKNMKEEGKLK